MIIKRGHQSQAGSGLANSILRYCDIVPTNNITLDGELNGLDENSLVFFKSDNLIDWSNQGFSSRDITGNSVSKNGVTSFSRWTLSGLNSPLPMNFTLFNSKCEGSKVLITSKTARERNSRHFNIERSSDGVRWTAIGNLPAAGNSGIERNYSFTDNNPLQNRFYRIAEYDLDRRVQYTSTLRSSYSATDVFSTSPNPVHDIIFINIVTGSESQAVIKVFDSKGALIKRQKATVLQGSNQLRMDIGSLANGVYTLYTDWNNGQMKKMIAIVKQ